MSSQNKECPTCGEKNHTRRRLCLCCGFEFYPKTPQEVITLPAGVPPSNFRRTAISELLDEVRAAEHMMAYYEMIILKKWVAIQELMNNL